MGSAVVSEGAAAAGVTGRGEGALDDSGAAGAATARAMGGPSSFGAGGAGEAVAIEPLEIASLWHLLHMPPVAELPKKPQPAAQRVGAEVSGARFDSMCGRISLGDVFSVCDRLSACRTVTSAWHVSTPCGAWALGRPVEVAGDQAKTHRVHVEAVGEEDSGPRDAGMKILNGRLGVACLDLRLFRKTRCMPNSECMHRISVFALLLLALVTRPGC